MISRLNFYVYSKKASSEKPTHQKKLDANLLNLDQTSKISADLLICDPCDQCDYKASRKNTLLTHMKSIHEVAFFGELAFQN